MDEIIVRVLRAVASSARLRILSCLIRTQETSPTELARKLGMALDLLSAHLRQLTVAGLIRRRRSGAWCYCIAESPYGEQTFSGRMAAWLRQVLRASKETTNDDSGVEHLRNSSLRRFESPAHEVVFDAATAFTNVRRLQMLRRLCRGEVVGVDALVCELKMSATAVSRQMDKLMRRGYAEASHAGRLLEYHLAPKFKTEAHWQLFEIVKGEWDKRELRT